ncbi:MAG: phytoene desaturase family protein [Nocardioidaceae bacterium]
MTPRTAEFDGVVIGGGQHGLILAAYLSRAGLKVAVFERRVDAGGAISTWESAPGVYHNLATHFKMHDGPVLRDLRLDRFGVAFNFPTVKTTLMGDGDESLPHFTQDPDRTARAFARFSPQDARTYQEMSPVWNDWYERFVLPELYHSPRPAEVNDQFIAGQPGGAEYLRAKNTPSEDYVGQLFEHDRVRALLLWMSGVSTYRGRGGMSTMAMHAFLSWLVRRTGLVRGGSRQFANGLVRFISHHGGAVFTGEHVEKVLIEGGRATGVRLRDGDTVRASRFVCSAVDVKQTMLKLVGAEHLDGQLVKRIRDFRLDAHSLFGVHLILREPVRYRAARGDPVIAGSMRFLVGLSGTEDLVGETREAQAAGLPDGRPIVMAGSPSDHDATLARDGAHTAYGWVMVPAKPHDAGVETWDALSEELAGRTLESWAKATENLSEANIIHRRVTTPLDLQRSFVNMVNGGLNMGQLSPDQSGVDRPARELSSYATPIEGLYLCGSSSHPGGQLTGATGYNAAGRIAKDLGMAPWWPAYPEIGTDG